MGADAVREENRKPKQDLSPVFNTSCPFTDYVHGGQLHFEQGVIRLEDAFSLCYLAELAMVALNHIGRVDQLSDFRRVF